MTTSDPERPSLRHPWVLVATGMGTGFLPWAPGTFASLAALPVAWLLVRLGGAALLIVASAAVFALGLWAAGRFASAVASPDPGAVVVDEVVGQWLALAAVPPDLALYALGFALFRALDILKPWPIRVIERKVGGSLGIMLDDVVAGILAALGLWLVARTVLA